MHKTEEFTSPPLVDVAFIFSYLLKFWSREALKIVKCFQQNFELKREEIWENECHILWPWRSKLFTFGFKMAVKCIEKRRFVKIADLCWFCDESVRKFALKKSFSAVGVLWTCLKHISDCQRSILYGICGHYDVCIIFWRDFEKTPAPPPQKRKFRGC